MAGGSVLPPEAGSSLYRLSVSNTNGQPITVTVLTLDRPAITGSRYALTGQIRYEKVEGAGYLELWSYFPDGSQFFSRTLGEMGPMMKLHGTSGWRSFALPFDATGAPHPTRLVMNVVLPAGGTVYLGPLRLHADAAEFFGSPLASAGEPSGNMSRLGAIAGAAVGLVGAMIGLLTSMGRARRLVTTAAMTLVVCGTLAFVAGGIAITRAQPYAVYYPLLLVGFLATVIPLGVMPAIRRRYEEIELRAMRARDLG